MILTHFGEIFSKFSQCTSIFSPIWKDKGSVKRGEIFIRSFWDLYLTFGFLLFGKKLEMIDFSVDCIVYIDE